MNLLLHILLFLTGAAVMWFLNFTTQNKYHALWLTAYQAGYSQAEHLYKGMLNFETSQPIIEARCLLLEEEWINNYNNKRRK